MKFEKENFEIIAALADQIEKSKYKSGENISNFSFITNDKENIKILNNTILDLGEYNSSLIEDFTNEGFSNQSNSPSINEIGESKTVLPMYSAGITEAPTTGIEASYVFSNVSNDPGKNPTNFRYFNTAKKENILGRSYKEDASYLFKYKLMITNEQSSISLKKKEKADGTFFSKIEKGDTKFFFKQKCYYETPSNTQDQVIKFFTTFPKSSETEYLDFQYGMPLDFQYYNLSGENQKDYGVANKQPEYTSEYNFYFENYEDTVIQVFDVEDLTDEKSLPSVYDFLYLEDQKELRPFIYLPNFDNADISLSSLNEYLDSYSSAYQKYLVQDDEKDFDDLHSGLLGNLTVGNINPGNLEIPDGKQFQDNGNSLSSKIDLNTSPQTQIKQKFEFLSETQIEQIKNKTPIWINNMKEGIYFKEQFLDTFEQGYDSRLKFPFYNNIEIPLEQMGPIASLLKKDGLLDSLNAYTAENIFSEDGTKSNFYGGSVINSFFSKKVNTYSDYKFSSFKVLFDKKEIKQVIEIEQEPAFETQDIPETKPKQNPFEGILEQYSKATSEFGKSEKSEEEKLLEELKKNSGSDFNTSGGVSQELVSALSNFLKDEDLGFDIFFYNSKPGKKDITLSELASYKPEKVLVYGRDEKKSVTNTVLGSLFNKLKALKAQNDLINLFEAKLVSVGESHRGKLCHQETLMYEIEKYAIDTTGERLIQRVFLPISNKNRLNFLDTQVIPFKDYTYKIYVHKAVIGTKYRINPEAPMDVNDNSKSSFTFSLNYDIIPYLQVIRLPYYNTLTTNNGEQRIVRVEDLPPLPPLVNFVPFKSVENKLLVLMNNSIGEESRKLQYFNNLELLLVKQIAKAQGKSFDSVLDFKSDDSQGVFQLLQLDKAPETYSDFTKAKNHIMISRDGEKSDSIILDIKPNIDYYFTARFFDIHNKFSNPTDVIRVKMIKETGYMPYLVVEPYDMNMVAERRFKEKYKPAKEMRKYLFIKLNDEQIYLTDGDSDELPTIEKKYNHITYKPALGTEKIKNSVFGKKFKLRLTSKQTGRKIDINVKVKQPNNIINE